MRDLIMEPSGPPTNLITQSSSIIALNEINNPFIDLPIHPLINYTAHMHSHDEHQTENHNTTIEWTMQMSRSTDNVFNCES